MPTNTTKYQYLVKAITEHKSDECLLWPFNKCKGYGLITFHGRNHGVHRVAFYLTNGVFPMPAARHICDTPACFNPRHIIPGTQKQNVADMIERGRTSVIGSKGENNPLAKLNDELVQQIRTEYRPRKHQRLHKKYGVSRRVIQMVINRLIWRHLP